MNETAVPFFKFGGFIYFKKSQRANKVLGVAVGNPLGAEGGCIPHEQALYIHAGD